ncbi:hypothetical protein C8R47DRAFT_1227214 [Mycena vitilis]|nr:hypothetical protein C8R47DRAFT_1227214 [Mycena vitilis]
MAPHHPHVDVNDRTQQIVSLTYHGARMIQASPFARSRPHSPFLVLEAASECGGSIVAGSVLIGIHRPSRKISSRLAARPASLELTIGADAGRTLYSSGFTALLLSVPKPQQPHIAARRVIKPMRSTCAACFETQSNPLSPISTPPSIVEPHATEVYSFRSFVQARYPEPSPAPLIIPKLNVSFFDVFILDPTVKITSTDLDAGNRGAGVHDGQSKRAHAQETIRDLPGFSFKIIDLSKGNILMVLQ